MNLKVIGNQIIAEFCILQSDRCFDWYFTRIKRPSRRLFRHHSSDKNQLSGQIFVSNIRLVRFRRYVKSLFYRIVADHTVRCKAEKTRPRSRRTRNDADVIARRRRGLDETSAGCGGVFRYGFYHRHRSRGDVNTASGGEHGIAVHEENAEDGVAAVRVGGRNRFRLRSACQPRAPVVRMNNSDFSRRPRPRARSYVITLRIYGTS